MEFWQFVRFLLLTYLNIELVYSEVRVKIYDHRAYHDPVHQYGRGPWKYFGHGYGIDYGYNKDGTESHERGYGFVKAYAREFCKEGNRCRPPDPDFWKKTTLTANGFSEEPYYARPPADVMEPRLPESVPEPNSNLIAENSDLIYYKNMFLKDFYLK